MGARMEKSNRRIALIGFAILMVGLGISDSLRGIFSGIFQTHFALTAKGLSTIIAVSYAGNLCFLLAGGRIMDKIDRKKAFLGFLAVWMCAMLVFLLTDNYYALLVGMFLAMGASTLLNTSITLITPFIFATSPAMIVNVLFFMQGFGTGGVSEWLSAGDQPAEGYVTVCGGSCTGREPRNHRCNVSGNGCIPDGMREESVRRLDEVAVDNPERVRSPESFRRSRPLFCGPIRQGSRENPVSPCRGWHRRDAGVL